VAHPAVPRGGAPRRLPAREVCYRAGAVSERDDRYNHSAKGRARYQRYAASPEGHAARDRHEATRGFLRKRLRALEAEKERVADRLTAVRKEIECLMK
jgi:hypothetical protein